jgi:hypothetical protein
MSEDGPTANALRDALLERLGPQAFDGTELYAGYLPNGWPTITVDDTGYTLTPDGDVTAYRTKGGRVEMFCVTESGDLKFVGAGAAGIPEAN